MISSLALAILTAFVGLFLIVLLIVFLVDEIEKGNRS